MKEGEEERGAHMHTCTLSHARARVGHPASLIA